MVRKNLTIAVCLTLILVGSLGAQTPIEPAKQVKLAVVPGPLNAITDVPGILVGSYEKNFTGTTVIYAPNGAVGGGNVVPIFPAAVLFDPGRFGRGFNDRPTAQFGRLAIKNASAGPVRMGNVEAGAGAVGGGLKGGLGTASVYLGDGVYVGAIVAVNAVGSTVNRETGEFYARYLEVNGEFGNLKRPFASIFGNGVEVASAAEMRP